MLSCSSISAATTTPYIPLSQKTPLFFSHSTKNHHPHHHFLLQIQSPIPFKKPKTSSLICLVTGVQELAEIAHNKVLIAATVSAVIGQLAKPYTSALIDKTDVNFKDLIRSGGFPSTHSSSVVAAATSLGLERGFSDSIFGMTVVFACIVMYDAQGVRREVGRHAKILNDIQLHNTKSKSIPFSKNKEDGIIDSNSRTSSIESDSLAPLLSISEKETSSTPNSLSTNSSLLKRPENITSRLNTTPPPNLTVDDNEVSSGVFYNRSPMLLKESIGHTEIEVIAGALLGFLVSIAVHIVL